MRSSTNKAWGQILSDRGSRRGSALVIVIGTLALISVFAAIYISIGRADTRSADTQRTRAKQQDFVDTYANYIAEVIAIDRFDATMQYADANLRYQVPRREGTDAPYTDWSIRSESDQEFEWFFPAGGNPYPRRNADRFDPRVSSDPWLASLRPGFYGAPGARPFSGTDINRRFLDNRDWYQISNVSPDGRFVNLFNLRPQLSFDGSAIGGFNAEPGWGDTNQPSGPSIRRMSEGLSLLRQRNDLVDDSPILSFDPLVDGFWVPGQREPLNLGLTPTEIQNTPAVWTMYQRFSLIPLDQAFVTYNRNDQVSTWADADYLAYQWADTDGDGFADARWFELTEARTAWGTRSDPRDDVQALYEGGDFRIFAATRIVDLSGMVNVNTARDSLIPPTADFPLGLTPAEVDLRRLLTMQDAAEDYDGDIIPLTRNEPLAFRHLRRPSWDRGTGREPPLLPESDYVRYEQGFLDGLLTLDPGLNLPTASNPNEPAFPNAIPIGRYAASAIQKSIELNVALPASYRGALSVPGLPATDPFHLSEGSSFARPGTAADDEAFSLLGARRAEYYKRVGAINPLRLDEAGVYSLSAADATNGFGDINDLNAPATGAQFYGMGLFGLDDLAELLTFHGLNDPEVDSRLEVAAMGRFQFDGGTGDERFSPLHSTRPLTLDRKLHGELLVRRLNPNRGTEVTGEISPESMAMLTLSPRSLLTVVSGSVPMRAGAVAGNAGRRGTELTPLGLSVERDAALSLSDVAQNPADAFNLYYRALAGELEVFRLKQGSGVDGLPTAILNVAWEPDLSISRESPYATLFYGHRGPELALRVAAHAAVNAADYFDGTDNTTTTVATLILDNASAVRNTVDRVIGDANYGEENFSIETNADALRYPGLLTPSSFFDLDSDGDGDVVDTREQVLPNSVLPDPKRALVNVYGVEPTPFITEVASMYVYTDASETNGGDVDYGDEPVPGPRPGLLPVIPPEILEQVTVDGSINDGNTDLLMQVFAVQLTNPWDVPIEIGGGEGAVMHRKQGGSDTAMTDAFDRDNNLIFDYYLEFNGRFFKLGNFVEYQETALDLTSIGGPLIAADTPITPDPGLPLAEVQYRGVTIQPGESRVFYAMAHARFDSPSGLVGLDERWEIAIEDSGGLPAQFDIGDPTSDPDGDGLPNGTDGRGYTGPAQEWISDQFKSIRTAGGQNSPPARIHPFNPQTGDLVYGVNTFPVGSVPNDAVFQDLMAPADPAADLGLTGRTAASNVVRLWKKHTALTAGVQVEETTRSQINDGNAGTYQQNLVQNDILIDRMFMDLELNVKMPDGDIPITNSVGFPEGFVPLDTSCAITDPAVLNRRNDNLGVTLTRWASVRRKETMDAITSAQANIEAGLGRIDAYLLSSRRTPTITTTDNSNTLIMTDTLDAEDVLNLCDADALDAFNGYQVGNRGVSTEAAYDFDRTLREFFASGLNGRQQIQTMAFHPRFKNLTGAVPAPIDPIENRFDAEELQVVPGSGLKELFSNAADALEPEVFIGNELDVARVTDALAPMGIGPAYAPDPTRNVLTNMEVFDDEWMTLSEALAVALGFEDFAGADLVAGADPDIVWHDAARQYTDALGATRTEYVLDDLRLRIDDYVPYLNVAQDPGETGMAGKPQFSFNFSSPAGSDARRGTGVPLALGVLDGVRAINPPLYAGQTTGDTNRSLTQPIMGLVNINTAPVEVLRLLPGLSPSAVGYRTMNGTGSVLGEWWAAAANTVGGILEGIAFDSDLGLPSLDPFAGAAPYANSPDVAAGLAGYRDRSVMSPRFRSNPVPYAIQDFSYAIDVSPANPTNQQAVLDNLYGENDGFENFRARDELTGIDGLRGAPGFGSLGEMLMASIDEDVLAANSGNQSLVAHRHVSMTQYGIDTDGATPGSGNAINLGVSGTGEDAVSMSPNFVSEESGIADQFRAGNVPNDYAEQLAIAAGVMNTTTTRSDFYAVWLVLQGFQESDVATLRENDPLVPSFKKRFLMVVDRSNVVEQGDAPQIVLFREVPL